MLPGALASKLARKERKNLVFVIQFQVLFGLELGLGFDSFKLGHIQVDVFQYCLDVVLDRMNLCLYGMGLRNEPQLIVQFSQGGLICNRQNSLFWNYLL